MNTEYQNDVGVKDDESAKSNTRTYIPSDAELGIREYVGFVSKLNRATADDGSTLWFARVGYFNGYLEKQPGEQFPKKRIANADVLLGKRLSQWAESLYKEEGESHMPSGYRKVIHRMRIKNLDYIINEKDGNAYLNNTGILESLSVGS